jgi:hypothetical protein
MFARRRHWLFLVIETVVIGGRTLWRFGRWIVLAQQRTDVTFCPRGHPVPLVGVWICALCRAPMEGHVWDRCRYCNSRPSWLPCPSCGLPVSRGGRR